MDLKDATSCLRTVFEYTICILLGHTKWNAKIVEFIVNLCVPIR